MRNRLFLAGIIIMAVSIIAILIAIGGFIYVNNLPLATEISPHIAHLNNYNSEKSFFWAIGEVGLFLLIIGISLTFIGKVFK